MHPTTHYPNCNKKNLWFINSNVKQRNYTTRETFKLRLKPFPSLTIIYLEKELKYLRFSFLFRFSHFFHPKKCWHEFFNTKMPSGIFLRFGYFWRCRCRLIRLEVWNIISLNYINLNLMKRLSMRFSENSPNFAPWRI